MAYARNTWNNDDPNTPLSAERLNRIEQGIESAHVTADAATVASEGLKTRVASLEKLKDQPAQVDPQAIKTAVTEALKTQPPVDLGPITKRLTALETKPVSTVREQVQQSALRGRLADRAGVKTRAIGVGWEDTSNAADRDWATIAQKAIAKGYNTIDLAVGRPEWTLFPWPAHPERVSIDAGKNPIRDTITTLRAAGIENIFLTLDMMISTTLGKQPEWKAVSRDGTIRDMPSPAALTNPGDIRDMLGGAVVQVAAEYGDLIDGIIITELFWDSGSFSAHDLTLYKSDTGATDWPRRGDGTPHESKEYQEWLTTKMADFIGYCRGLTGGIPLIMDVRANWATPVAGDVGSGHDYSKLLRVADELQVWAYYTTGDEAKATALSAALDRQWPGRIRTALGLWSASPTSVGQVLTSLTGAHRVQVTPYSKMGSLL